MITSTQNSFSEDLVSVVISAYNHQQYVQKTLQSILDQTYPCIELIIVNDGSTDHTHDQIQAMLPKLQKRMHRVEYRNKSNEGVIRSLNLCLSLAKGRYVYFIASDDVAKPEAIEILHDFLAKNSEFGLAVGDDEIIDADGVRCYWNKKRDPVYDIDQANALTFAEHLQKTRPDVDFGSSDFGTYRTLLEGNYIPNGFLIRKTILNQIGGYSEAAPLEDLYLMLQISKISKLKYIDRILFSYRWHATNTIRKPQQQGYLRQTLLLEIPYAKQLGLQHYIKREYAFRFLRTNICRIKISKKQTKILLFDRCIFKKSIHNGYQIIFVFGIAWKRRITAVT
jgi:alpha-1,3-rhamnosyltransferase